MDDYFIIPVNIDGKELEFEGKLLLQGYIHRIEVMVDEVPVLFEPDEEGSYCALVTAEQLEGKEFKQEGFAGYCGGIGKPQIRGKTKPPYTRCLGALT